MMYRKKFDEVLMGRARLKNKDLTEEDWDRILENGLPKKMCDPGNFVLPVRDNGTTSLSALADTRASVSVLPYTLYMNLGLGNPRPYHPNLTMADNTQAKAMGEVRNVRIQIGFQAYLVDLLVLDIPIDKELPFLLGRPFLKTCGAMIEMGRGTMTIDDGVIKHTYYPQPRTKAYLENFESDKSEYWMSCFEVGRDQDGNPQYGPVAPSFLDIEDEMERALVMEAYFNPFKNIIVFKKLIDFLGSLPVALKNNDWGSEGYGAYKKIEGDGAWHAKF
ncbi:putative ribonuclease H-like domain-containing protein [Tanacetum coccineum]